MTTIPQTAAKARLHDALQKRGHELPLPDQASPPMVQWFHQGCRKRVLRLYLTPAGWVLVGERFSETLDEWLERTGLDRAIYDESVVVDAQLVDGAQRVLPLSLDEWPRVRFEVGCARHKIGHVSLDVLKNDAQEARSTRRSKTRSLSVGDLV